MPGGGSWDLKISPLKKNSYQLVALTKLFYNKQRALLITDGVGVGKTIAAGYTASFFSKNMKGPIVVISPNILVDKWRAELHTKFGIDARPVTSIEELETAEGELQYYHKLKKNVAYIFKHSLFGRKNIKLNFHPLLIIIDEIHNFRNPRTIASKKLLELCNNAEYRIGLSATPINNSLDDLITEFGLLFPNIEQDTLAYSVGEVWQTRKFGLISSLLTRFEKENLDIHFAKRNVSTHRISYETSYITEVRNLIKERSGRKETDSFFMDEMTLFRLASSSPKAIEKALGRKNLLAANNDSKLSKLLEISREKDDERIIIFCEFKKTAKYLENNLRNERTVFVVTGDTPYTERQPTLDEFRKNSSSVLILTSVGSEGIDLQFCSAMINYDLHWNPMKLEQRIGRIDRIGQEKNIIEIHNFIVAGSIDERIVSILSKKLKLIEQTVLSTDAIIRTEGTGIQTKTSEINLLPDKEFMQDEVQESKDLLRAFEQSSKIKLDDYKIIKAINPRFCDPEFISNLKEPPGLPWIKGGELKNWILELTRSSINFAELLESYR